jgi:hypothetical protein
MKARFGAAFASLALAPMALLAPWPAAADGELGPATATPLETFGRIAYVEYNGLFEGETSTGAYRVPYRITAPEKTLRSNRTVLVEPSHFALGLGTLTFHMGRDFLLSRGFEHAGIGWSTASGGPGADLRILDPDCESCFIDGGFFDFGGRTDDEIIADFARALGTDAMLSRCWGILGTCTSSASPIHPIPCSA